MSRKRRRKTRSARNSPQPSPSISPPIDSPENTGEKGEVLDASDRFPDVVNRLRFGDVATEAEARVVIRKGLSLAASATTSREYSTAMRVILQIAKFQRELEGFNPPAAHVHNHLHIETPEQKQQRLASLASELGVEDLFEEGG